MPQTWLWVLCYPRVNYQWQGATLPVVVTSSRKQIIQRAKPWGANASIVLIYIAAPPYNAYLNTYLSSSCRAACAHEPAGQPEPPGGRGPRRAGQGTLLESRDAVIDAFRMLSTSFQDLLRCYRVTVCGTSATSGQQWRRLSEQATKTPSRRSDAQHCQLPEPRLPSHPVQVRAKQHFGQDKERMKNMGVLLHGDGAFAGQVG